MFHLLLLLVVSALVWPQGDAQACVAGQVARAAKAGADVQKASQAAAVAVDQVDQLAADRFDIACDSAVLASTAATVHTVATGSAATIMGTMAGASTASGVAVLAAPGVATAAVLNKTVYVGCHDQHACDNAQVGNYAGAALGTAASATALVSAGAGPAGLAAIGSTLGGGMAVGAATVIAAPVVAAVAVGGLVYWLSQ